MARDPESMPARVYIGLCRCSRIKGSRVSRVNIEMSNPNAGVCCCQAILAGLVKGVLHDGHLSRVQVVGGVVLSLHGGEIRLMRKVFDKFTAVIKPVIGFEKAGLRIVGQVETIVSHACDSCGEVGKCVGIGC